MNLRRLAGRELIVGTGDEIFRYRLWPLFEGVALVGDVIIALGLPVILAFAGRATKLHAVGYAGIFAALVMLNVGEGTTEAFVKPYLVDHGGRHRSPRASRPSRVSRSWPCSSARSASAAPC